MNKLMGIAPRHPGLWVDLTETEQYGNQTIQTLQTITQGEAELSQLCNQLASLSQQGRWIVLISPPHIGYKHMLASAGVRLDRILLVHTKDEVETLWAMEKALTSGTSSAVITWTRSLDSRDSRRLEIVAKSARAFGVVIEDVNAHSPQKNQFVNPNLTTATSNFCSFH